MGPSTPKLPFLLSYADFLCKKALALRIVGAYTEKTFNKFNDLLQVKENIRVKVLF